MSTFYQISSSQHSINFKNYKKNQIEFKNSYCKPKQNLKSKHMHSLANISYPEDQIKQKSLPVSSTIEKLKLFIRNMKQKELIDWFERYLEKTQAQFHHNFFLKQRPNASQKYRMSLKNIQTNLAECECYYQSRNYGCFGPIRSSGKNASQSLIECIKKLIFDEILEDQNCNKQIMIDCLKLKRNDESYRPKTTNNHKLKIKKSPRFDQIPNSIISPNDENTEEKIQLPFPKQEDNDSKNCEQLQKINGKIRNLEIQIQKQKQIHQKLKQDYELGEVKEKKIEALGEKCLNSNVNKYSQRKNRNFYHDKEIFMNKCQNRIHGTRLKTLM